VRILGDDSLGAKGGTAGLLPHPGGFGFDLFDHLGDPLLASRLRKIVPTGERRQRDRFGLGTAEAVVLLAACSWVRLNQSPSSGWPSSGARTQWIPIETRLRLGEAQGKAQAEGGLGKKYQLIRRARFLADTNSCSSCPS
jgi:hypothetical protein